MTSLYRRLARGHVCWGRSDSQSTASNASAVVIGRKKSMVLGYLVLVIVGAVPARHAAVSRDG